MRYAVLIAAGVLLAVTPALAQSRVDEAVREKCRAQSRAELGNADRATRQEATRRCIGRAAASGERGDASQARNAACRDEARRMYSPGNAAAGRGQVARRDLIQAHIRDCMRRGT